MGYVYNVYGPEQVEYASKVYNNVANSAPNYADSAATGIQYTGNTLEKRALTAAVGADQSDGLAWINV